MSGSTRSKCFVHVREMLVIADIGVHHHEIGRPQEIIVSVDIEINQPADDRVDCTLDYKLVEQLADRIAQQRIGLIETYAKTLASEIMDNPQALSVRVRVDKPRALESGMAGVTVEMNRAGNQAKDSISQ